MESIIYCEVPNHIFGLNVCQFFIQKTFQKKSIGLFNKNPKYIFKYELQRRFTKDFL